MNLIGNKNAVEMLTRAATRYDKEQGLKVAYAEGEFCDNINQTEVGKMAYSLYEQGKVRLFQKKIQDSPRRYQYIAEVV